MPLTPQCPRWVYYRVYRSRKLKKETVISSELSMGISSLSYGRRSIDQFVLVSGSPLGPMTRFYLYPFFSDNCIGLPVGRPLWREDGSVTYNTIADRSGHWGPITIHYSLIWDCVSSSSPLTARRDYGGGILTCLHTGWWYIVLGRNDTNSRENAILH
jgi:hypothetical protein